jgi:hypothetical protein
MVYSDESWKPTAIKRIGRSEETSTGVTQVLTDCGWAYGKPLGNRQGEHALASEWVCLMLARWLGLPTFRGAIITLEEDVTFPLPEHNGQKYYARAGPCFITESTPGRKWDRSVEDLDRLTNPDDVVKLVVFDTWALNRDRHYPDYSARKPNYDNVYFATAERDDEYRLVAMDHTHCFDNGQLHNRLGNIQYVKDERVYGLFPEFFTRISSVTLAAPLGRLKAAAREMVEPILAQVPREWEVDEVSRAAWLELIVGRAQYLAENLAGAIQVFVDQARPNR